jgi:hypothetical protein
MFPVHGAYMKQEVADLIHGIVASDQCKLTPGTQAVPASTVRANKKQNVIPLSINKHLTHTSLTNILRSHHVYSHVRAVTSNSLMLHSARHLSVGNTRLSPLFTQHRHLFVNAMEKLLQDKASSSK